MRVGGGQREALAGLLAVHLPWHRARLMFAAAFILALIQLGTSNLGKVALALNQEAKVASNYRRIQRFFAHFPVDDVRVARLMLALLPQRQDFVVTLDRTHWMLGKINLNILMVGIAYRSVAFPIVWTLLGKAGCSNCLERSTLIKRFLAVVPRQRILAGVADREFASDEWFGVLSDLNLPFVIRIRKNALVTYRGVTKPIERRLDGIQLGEVRCSQRRMSIYGHKLYLTSLKRQEDDVLIVSSQKFRDSLAIYAQRWEIETLFSCLKSRGFDMEATHLYYDERVSKLVTFLAIAFAWAHLVGEWLHEQKPIAIKKHGRKAKSFFRYGLDHLRHLLLGGKNNRREFARCLQCLTNATVLSCT